MHSRIYEISADPIDKDARKTSEYYTDSWFVGSIADYVSDLGDDKDSIEWLGMCDGLEVDYSERIMRITDKKAYFSYKFKKFKDAYDSLKNLTLEEFTEDGHDLGFMVYRMNAAYSDKTGFYVDLDDSLMTLDEWVRMSPEGTTVFIGGTVDYHC